MRKWRICENKRGLFKIQFRVLGLIWWNWKPHMGGIIMHFDTYELAEKEIDKLVKEKNDNKLFKKAENAWSCRGEYYG